MARWLRRRFAPFGCLRVTGTRRGSMAPADRHLARRARVDAGGGPWPTCARCRRGASYGAVYGAFRSEGGFGSVPRLILMRRL